MTNYLLALPALLLLAGCGGISDGTELTSLTADDADAVCAELADAAPAREVTCGEGDFEFTFTLGVDEAECASGFEPVESASCTATVGDMKDCMSEGLDLSDEELCEPSDEEPEISAACQAIFDCLSDE